MSQRVLRESALLRGSFMARYGSHHHSCARVAATVHVRVDAWCVGRPVAPAQSLEDPYPAMDSSAHCARRERDCHRSASGRLWRMLRKPIAEAFAMAR